MAAAGDNPIPIVVILGSAAFMVWGIVIRLGGNRQGVRDILRTLPGYRRNVICAMIPGGLGTLLLFAAVLLDPEPPTADLPPLALALMGLGFVGWVIFFWWLIRPPAWTKPAWLREEERATRERMAGRRRAGR